MSDVEEQVEEDSSVKSELTNNSPVFSCQKCEVSFTTLPHLKHDEKFCRGPKLPALIVEPSQVTRDIHAKVVDGKQMYLCELCNYQANSRAAIRKHLPKHTAVRPFQCEVCKKAFTASCDLNKHKLVHSIDKPYKCTECSYATQYAPYFRKRAMIHTGEKVFACKQCDYRSNQSAHLKLHTQTKHTDEKPFSCAHCEYKTAVKSNLTKHMMEHSENSA